MKRLLMPFLLIMGLSKVNAQACLPDFLGPDISETVCPGEFVNLENYFSDLSGFSQVSWSKCSNDGSGNCFDPVPDPTSAPPGIYKLRVVDAQGCIDVVTIIIAAESRPVGFVDVTLQVCEGLTTDLTTVYTNLTGYIVDYTWNTQTPQSVGPGSYLITAASPNNCAYQATVTIQSIPSVNPALTNVKVYNMGGAQSSSFTTNSFRCLAVDQLGGVWAGSNGGGIYYFDGRNWTKKPGDATKTYRELVVTNQLSEGPRVWAATTGDNTANAIGGGIHYIQGITTNARKRFSSLTYSCIGDCPNCTRILVDKDGGLSSRFATSIVELGNKLFAGLSLCVDLEDACNGNTLVVKNGGLFMYDYTTNAPAWTKVENVLAPLDDIKVTAVGKRGTQIWTAYQNGCFNNGATCFEPFIGKYDAVTGLPAGFVKSENSPLPFSGNPIIRAIFTDSRGNTFVGLSNGKGIGVLNAAGDHWDMITSQNSKLPAGASVNFNAIAEANDGRVFIGTTGGLLEYIGSGSFTICTSYRIYTTASGLPSNNVTDVAYSTNGLIWIATDNGICSVGDKIPSISGSIAGASAGRPGSAPEELKLTPLENVSVKLFSGGVDGPFLGEYFTNADGFFKIPALTDVTNYRLKITYNFRPGFTAGTGVLIYPFNYLIQNLKNDTVLGVIPMPDSLLFDAFLYNLPPYHTPFVENLKEEFVEISIPIFSGPLTPKLGFDIDQYNMDRATGLYSIYENPSVPVSADFMKRVRNLVGYYFLMQMMETGTKNSTKLSTSTAEFFLDAVEYFLKALDRNIKWKMYETRSDALAGPANKIQVTVVKLAAEEMLAMVRYAKTKLIQQGYPDAAKAVKQVEDILKYLIDFVSKTLIESPSSNPKDLPRIVRGAKTAAQGYGVDLIKKVIAATIGPNFAMSSNKNRFQNRMNEAANGYRDLLLGKDYGYNYDLLKRVNTDLGSEFTGTVISMENAK